MPQGVAGTNLTTTDTRDEHIRAPTSPESSGKRRFPACDSNRGGTMEKTPYVSPNLQDREREYLEMRQALLDKLEDEVKADRQEKILQFADEKEAFKAAEKEQTEETELLDSIGLSADKIKALEKRDLERMKAYEKAVDPKLVGACVDRKSDHRQKIASALRFDRMSGVRPVCVGADAVVSNKAYLGDAVTKGSLGNPGYWFYDPADVVHPKVNHYGDSSASGCAFWMIDFPEYFYLSWQYIWDPGVNGPGDVWNWLLAEVRYQGFYSVYAKDRWYNCKHAIVHGTLDIDILQDGWLWNGAKKRELFYRKVRKGGASNVVNGSVIWDENVSLDPNQSAMCAITLKIKCEAKGSGTHSKINFLDANPSYIGPPILIIGT